MRGRSRRWIEGAVFGALVLALTFGFVNLHFLRPGSAMAEAVAIHQGVFRGEVLPADQASTRHAVPSVGRAPQLTIVARHNWGPFGEPTCDGYRVRGVDEVRRYTWDAERPCSAAEVAALLLTTVE